MDELEWLEKGSMEKSKRKKKKGKKKYYFMLSFDENWRIPDKGEVHTHFCI